MRTERQIAEELIEALLETKCGPKKWRLVMNARIELDQLCSATSSPKRSFDPQCTKFPERFHLSRLS